MDALCDLLGISSLRWYNIDILDVAGVLILLHVGDVGDLFPVWAPSVRDHIEGSPGYLLGLPACRLHCE